MLKCNIFWKTWYNYSITHMKMIYLLSYIYQLHSDSLPHTASPCIEKCGRCMFGWVVGWGWGRCRSMSRVRQRLRMADTKWVRAVKKPSAEPGRAWGPQGRGEQREVKLMKKGPITPERTVSKPTTTSFLILHFAEDGMEQWNGIRSSWNCWETSLFDRSKLDLPFTTLSGH